MKIAEYLVVGSGCSAAMTAQTLVESGADVTLVDVGLQNKNYNSLVPQKSFVSIRTSEEDQYKYFIGEQGEGIVWGDISKGAQITPPRKHMAAETDKYLPVDSNSFSPLESLGYGGLGIGWGLQCWEFSDDEVAAAGLDTQLMPEAYETVSSRIGISATRDDASQYTMVHLKKYQPSPRMDRNNARIYQNFARRKNSFHKKGFYLGRTPLALLTENLGDRKKYGYHDMDFYTDQEQSAWRPWITINYLKNYKNFTYVGGHLVTSFKEKSGYVEINCLQIPNDTPTVLRAKKLILATGALGSGRIALRSLGKSNTRLPLLSNPYTYIPCLQPSMVGKTPELEKLGFAQLSLFLDEDHSNFDVSIASLYTYQSLMLFRLIRQVPFLNLADARLLMRYLVTGLVIMGVHHPDEPSSQKYITLVKDRTSPTGDRLKAVYELDNEVKAKFAKREKKFMSTGRRLGIFSIKKVDPGHGAGLHYAGTLPFCDEEKPLTLAPSGKLHGTKHVYVADSSGFNYLPARGLTFSLLANAHITARKALEND